MVRLSGCIKCNSKRRILGIENNFLSNRCRVNRLCGGGAEDSGDLERRRTSMTSPGEINGRCFAAD